jgi:hypothetical protein
MEVDMRKMLFECVLAASIAITFGSAAASAAPAGNLVSSNSWISNPGPSRVTDRRYRYYVTAGS